MVERMGNMLGVAAFGAVGTASRLVRARELKEIPLHGTLTQSLRLGQAMGVAAKEGQDPIDAIVEETDGWLLSRGDVRERRSENRAGYLSGEYNLTGLEEFAGHSFRIWFKNENQGDREVRETCCI